jgi:hypothetical protein
MRGARRDECNQKKEILRKEIEAKKQERAELEVRTCPHCVLWGAALSFVVRGPRRLFDFPPRLCGHCTEQTAILEHEWCGEVECRKAIKRYVLHKTSCVPSNTQLTLLTCSFVRCPKAVL